jgi:hypothetical protein
LDGALNSERNDRIAEDALLRTDINSNRADIDRNRVDINRNTSDIQRNRKGIAMVAAMTHTTLLPGNESLNLKLKKSDEMDDILKLSNL